MSSVDSRIVTMKFDNKQFAESLAQTIGYLEKLKKSLDFSANKADLRFENKGFGDEVGEKIGFLEKLRKTVDFSANKVNLKFENQQFGDEIGRTIGFLDKLKGSFDFSGAKKSMSDLQNVAGGVNLNPIGASIDGVSLKFLALSTVAITALSNITSKAIDSGAALAKSLTIAPISAGFSEYELKLGSIQTIMAGSGASLEVVNQKLQELNEYSDKTIYSFADMTKNIGKFTNAGVSLDQSVASIKGVANVAALSGANAEEASRAMYNFAQALSSGSVKLLDWKSIELANMGTVEFKQQLIDAAVAMGTLTKAGKEYKTEAGNTVSATKGFNESLADQWLSSKVLTDTLGKYSDATTDIGKRATAAASDVKTYTQMIDTLKESAGSGWASTWEIVFGDFNEAKALFTNVNNVLGGMIGKSAETRNNVLMMWKAFGGRDELIKGIANVFNALLAVIKPIKDAFREIFPAKTGTDLFKMTVAFREFTEKLKIGAETAKNLKRTFAGVFAIFSIAGQIIGGAVRMLLNLFGLLGEGSGSFLNFTGGVGDFLVSLDAMLKKTGLVKKFFEGLGEILALPLKLLAGIGMIIGKLFLGFDTGGAASVGETLDGLGKKMEPLQRLGTRIKDLFERLGDSLSRVGDELKKIAGKIGETIGGMFTPEAIERALGIVEAGLLGGILLLLKNFFKGKDSSMSFDFGGGLFAGAKEALGSVTGAMKTMQQDLKADILLKIAIALGIMAISIMLLSTIDSAKLATALGGLAIGLGGLTTGLVVMSSKISYLATLKLPLIVAALAGLGVALLLIALALKTFSTMNIGEIAQGLIAMGGALWIIKKAIIPIAANSPGMLKAAASLILLGVALNLIAVAMKIFATMSFDEIGRGLLAMAGALTVIVLAMYHMPPNMLLQAAALVVLAVALNGIGLALKLFGTMSLPEIGKGLLALAGALAVIAAAMWAMPPHMLAQSVALIAVAVALNILALALKSMGTMTGGEIAKSLITLAGALIILAAGLYAMTGTLAGAAALVVATAALAVLTPIIITLGSLDWKVILTALAALAGVFVVLGLAGLILAPLVPVLLGLGLAIVLIGAGFALAGAGVLAFGLGFAALVGSVIAGVVVIAGVLETLIKSIPDLLGALGRGIVEMAKALAAGVPAFFEAASKVISAILDAIIVNAPKVAEAFLSLLMALLRIISESIPKIADAGLRLILGLLEAMERNVPRIIQVASDLIVKFLDSMAANVGRVIQAGVNFIISFINGVADAIEKNDKAFGEAGGRLAVAIVQGFIRGLDSAGGVIRDAAINAAKGALKAAMGALGIGSPSKEFFKLGRWSDEGMANGLTAYSGVVKQSAADVAFSALNTMKSSMARVVDAVSGDIDMNPVIAPVIDLTQFRRDAGQMSGLLNVAPVNAAVSFDQATAISADRQQAKKAEAADQPTPTPAPNVFTFEQKNYSPEALSASEIFRQTKNQLSQAKQALGV